MFRKLRNKLIWINLGITTVVIVVAFSAIYLFATHAASERPPMPEGQTEVFSDDFENVINISIRREKQAAANDLLIMLIVSGIAIELIVALVSYYLADEAIKPVREAYEAQKIFIANASHEIKTPLAAISANLEAADIRNNKWISNVEKETNKLTKLNNELLTLARTDLMTNSVGDEVDLKKVTMKLIESFEPRLREIEFQQSVTTTDKIKMVVADYSQIFNILMDNAIKYCNKKIILKITNHELVISNDGAKIPKDESAHVFERFYQIDKSADGVGLGLSIAQSIAMRNGWSLTVQTKNDLTCFRLRF